MTEVLQFSSSSTEFGWVTFITIYVDGLSCVNGFITFAKNNGLRRNYEGGSFNLCLLDGTTLFGVELRHELSNEIVPVNEFEYGRNYYFVARAIAFVAKPKSPSERSPELSATKMIVGRQWNEHFCTTPGVMGVTTKSQKCNNRPWRHTE